MAAALTPISRSTFSAIGTSMAFLTMGVRHDTSPTPLSGASWTGSVRVLALAVAMATA